MTKYRHNAMFWWKHDLHHSEKEYLSQEFYGRKFYTLTGREIENIWKTTKIESNDQKRTTQQRAPRNYH